MKRLLAILGIGLWISACGSTAKVEGSGGGDDTEDRSGGSAGVDAGGDAGGDDLVRPPDIVDPNIEPDGGGPRGCQPVTCEETEAECGNVPDGCGGILNCGGCGDGFECGIVADNECTRLVDLCIPVDKDEACAGKECGREGDGCGGTYNCGSCEDGEGCGVKAAFQCDVVLTSTSTTGCDAEIKSCAEVGANCGKIGNGCGGILDCDAEAGCGAGELCGVDEPNTCGTPPVCEPIDPAVACAGKCGIVSNGCGEEVNDGVIDCSEFEEYRCPDGQACGAGGVPGQCGNAEEACVALEKAAACGELECGVAGDGCGGSHVCGTCSGSATCRAGVCVEPVCTIIPESTACGDHECGSASDGCGGIHECGTCPSGQACGQVEAHQCDAPTTGSCQALTPEEACLGKECGDAYDGCGSAPANRINCGEINGGCGAGQFCGIVTPHQCDAPPADDCTPKSCVQLGWECGTAVECGDQLVHCGGCNAMQTCMGGVDGPALCEGGDGQQYDDCEVCESIPNHCADPKDTKISGRVITPGKTNGNTANQVGVPNAYVYILRNRDASELPVISQGIPTDGGMACERCEDEDLGPVLVSTITDSHGNYTIAGNIPIDEDFLLVVKIGKWRRVEQVKLNADRACKETVIQSTRTRLPRSRQDGFNNGQGTNIPRIAISTGAIDAMECVFYKMGVSSNEFVHPGSSGQNAGRIHMYRGGNSGGSLNGYGGTLPSGSPVNDSVLYENKSRVFSYDMLVFDCEGAAYSSSPPNSTHRGYVREYVNAGGRMFASHLRHQWFHGNGNTPYNSNNPLATGLAAAASFDGSDGASEPPGNGYLHDVAGHQHQDKMQRYRDWLINENAVTQSGGDYRLDINDARMMFSSVNSNVEKYVLTRQGSTRWEQQFAFNTPYGAPAEAICGRIAYSAFHVSAAGGSSYTPFSGRTFPAYCDDLTGQSLNDQEKTLLYMLFDLAACVSEDGPPPPPSCIPATVDDCDGRCGSVPDGCGGTVSCGGCAADEFCNSGNVCEEPECIPTTCGQVGATCGTIGDGCGGVLECGDCHLHQVCGLLTPNQCSPTCTPSGENEVCNSSCGFVSDGCGGVHDCGGCPQGQSCVAGVCTGESCEPLTECPAGKECGVISDGCDGSLECGTCELPDVCGGSGQANVCGRPECTPLTCDDFEAECGFTGDGCGGSLNCGDCPPGQQCGLGGPNRCGGCEPRSCDDVNAECGVIGDGCGATVDCGSCPGGEICGAEVANQCGEGQTCSPRNCGSMNAECGVIGDGCGDTVDCGECPPGQLCGIEQAFQCGDPPECEVTTCEAVEAECGSIGDGCGGLLNCGACPSGFTCGRLAPNKCAPPPGPGPK